MINKNEVSSTKYKYEFYIGCNDKDSKQDNSDAIIERVKLFFLEKFGFYTMSILEGAYTHNDNIVVAEKTCKVELLLNGYLTDIELICATLKELCNQESILVTITKVFGGLY